VVSWFEDCGTCVKPAWFNELKAGKDRALFRKVVFYDNQSYAPNKVDDFFADAWVVHKVDKDGKRLRGLPFENCNQCTMCAFVTSACFFPELCVTNIVEYAPLMNRASEIIDGYVPSHDEIKLQCFECALCGSYQPGRYDPVLHPLVVMTTENADKFKDREFRASYELSEELGYQSILMRMIKRRDVVIFMNNVIRDMLANTFGPQPCKVWSASDGDLPLIEQGWTSLYFGSSSTADWKLSEHDSLIGPGPLRESGQAGPVNYGTNDYWLLGGKMVNWQDDARVTKFVTKIGYGYEPSAGRWKSIYDRLNSRPLWESLIVLANIPE
jgi:hypothetical protein